jgi:hypothetical protein
MSTELTYRHFLLTMAVASLLSVVLCCIAVLLIDPYRLYRLIDMPGFNQEKPFPQRFQKEIKLSGAVASHANAIILGNSRAEIGFNPDYRGWSEKGYSAYDLAIAGTGLAISREQLDSLQQGGHAPALLVLGADFLDFLSPPQWTPGPVPLNKADSLAGLQWQFDSAFSMQSVTDAIKTLSMQNAREEESMTARGFNPLREYVKYAREQGYYALFQQRAQENAKAFLKKRQFTVLAPDSQTPSWHAFDGIVSAAGKQGSTLHIVIYPYHAQLLAMFEQLHWWPQFEQWKRYLVQRVAFWQAAYPQAHVTLWDFSGFTSYQCQPIPAKGNKVQGSPWYWEGGHFKPALGDLILAQVLDVPQTGGVAFGQHLDAATLETDSQRIARERASCVAANPQVFDSAAALVATQN